MGSWQIGHINGFAILVMLGSSVPLIVAEAVFDTNNDPERLSDQPIYVENKFS